MVTVTITHHRTRMMMRDLVVYGLVSVPLAVPSVVLQQGVLLAPLLYRRQLQCKLASAVLLGVVDWL